MTKFEIGKTYETRSICDHDCIYSFTVLERTEKTVTIVGSGLNGAKVKRGVKVREGIEFFRPYGVYSMSPTVYADKATH